jgi:hypothetical protein
LPDAQSLFGRGLSVQDSAATGTRASVVVTRSLFVQNHDFGVFVTSSDATVEATVVRDTLPDAQGYGRAFQVQHSLGTRTAASATLRACLFERSVGSAISVAGVASAEVEACNMRDTRASEQGVLGDGLVVWSYAGPASASVMSTRIEESARAAVSSFGATVALGSSLLVCQSFDIGAESWNGQGAVVEDRGGVLCGCPEATGQCKAQSYALEPPPPVGE